MNIALLVMLVFATLDLFLFFILLLFVGTQYRSLRRIAAVNGQPLPSVAGQFAFLGILLTVGLVMLYVALLGLMTSE